MLSPHEFAVLMRVKASPDPFGMARAQLDTLLERQRVALEMLASGQQRPCVTHDGDSLLQAMMRTR